MLAPRWFYTSALMTVLATSEFSGVAYATPCNYLEAPSLPGYSLTASGFTAEFWVRADTLTGSDPRIASAFLSSFAKWEFAVCRSSCGPGRVDFNVMIGGVPHELLSTTSITDGNFHHVAATYDGSSIALYVDGVAENTQPFPGLTLDLAAGTLRVGEDALLDFPFDGFVDEFRIWQVARSASEIASSASLELGPGSGLVSSWHFNGNLADAVGSNTLTPHDAASYIVGPVNQAVALQAGGPCSGGGPGPGPCPSASTSNGYLRESVQCMGHVGNDVALALRANGEAVISHVQRLAPGSQISGVFLAKELAGAWQSERILQRGAGTYYSSTCLNLAANDEPRVAFVELRGDSSTLYYSVPQGGGWTNEVVDALVRTETISRNLQDASLALDGSGNPRIAYVTLAGPPIVAGLRYAARSGGVWTIAELDPPFGPPVSLAVDAAGDSRLVCTSTDGPTLALVYAHRTSSGWESETVVPETYPTFTSLKLDSSGEPHLAWVEGVGGGLFYAHRVAGQWQVQQLTSSETGDCPAISPCSLALDAQDRPMIAIRDECNSGLFVATWSGSEWTTTEIDNPVAVSRIALAAGGTGPHVAYQAGAADLRYARPLTAVGVPQSSRSEFGRLSVWPNPSFRGTSIGLTLGNLRGKIEIGVYDLVGRLVQPLWLGEAASAPLVFRWNGLRAGRPAAPGMYWVRATDGERVATASVVRLDTGKP